MRKLRGRIPTPVLLMAVVLVAALASAAWQGGGLSRLSLRRAAAQPEDTVLAAFEAAKEGRDLDYLALFTGKMLTDLAGARREMGEERFRQYLRESASSVKGIALSDRADVEEGKVRVRVEYVYAEKNDVQHYTLRREGTPRRAWKVCDISATRRARTIIPYGTEAVPLGQ